MLPFYGVGTCVVSRRGRCPYVEFLHSTFEGFGDEGWAIVTVDRSGYAMHWNVVSSKVLNHSFCGLISDRPCVKPFGVAIYCSKYGYVSGRFGVIVRRNQCTIFLLDFQLGREHK